MEYRISNKEFGSIQLLSIKFKYQIQVQVKNTT